MIKDPRLICPKCRITLQDAWYMRQKNGIIVWGRCNQHGKLPIGNIPGLHLRFETTKREQKRQKTAKMSPLKTPNNLSKSRQAFQRAKTEVAPDDAPKTVSNMEEVAFQELSKFAQTARANLTSPILLISSFLNHMDETGRSKQTQIYQHFPKELLAAARRFF